jgi:hypothetical protein
MTPCVGNGCRPRVPGSDRQRVDGLPLRPVSLHTSARPAGSPPLLGQTAATSDAVEVYREAGLSPRPSSPTVEFCVDPTRYVVCIESA